MTEHPDPADQQPDADREGRGGQVSEGPSGFSASETTTGGADAVPDTPDGVEADFAE